MPKEIQNPRTSYGLVDATGVKGRFPMQLDEVSIAAWQVLDLERSPYSREARPCGTNIAVAAPGAGLFPIAAVQAGAGTILQVLGISFDNSVGANVITRVRIWDATNWGLVTVTATNNLTDWNNDNPTVINPLVSSLALTANHNIVVGVPIYGARLTANSGNHVVSFPYGYNLYGDAGTVLGVMAENANCTLNAAFICREFTPKG